MNRITISVQILMIIVAVLIVVLYIRPTISKIGSTQDLLTSYEEQTGNVEQLNQTLRAKLSEIDSIPTDDIEALNKFIPDTIDDISVLKDISALARIANISTYNVEYEGGDTSAEASVAIIEDDISPETEVKELVPHNFSLSFVSSYGQIKSLLSLLESNSYVLQVSEMQISNDESGQLNTKLTLTAFSRLKSNKVDVTQN